ncbi:MAG: hypothetical protein ACFB2W_00665 [Leptolyngbyaceae cyanobacterium]
MATHPLVYRQAATNAIADLLDVGAGANATLEIGDSGFATVLITFPLQDPSFGAADGSATATAAGLPISANATATGTAAEYRYKDKDGTVGPSGTVASGEITLSDTSVVSGNTYNLTSAAFTNA